MGEAAGSAPRPLLVEAELLLQRRVVDADQEGVALAAMLDRGEDRGREGVARLPGKALAVDARAAGALDDVEHGARRAQRRARAVAGAQHHGGEAHRRQAAVAGLRVDVVELDRLAARRLLGKRPQALRRVPPLEAQEGIARPRAARAAAPAPGRAGV